MTDYLSSRAESNRLVTSIESHWHRRGYSWVDAWVERITNYVGLGGKPHDTFVVRSNVVMNTRGEPTQSPKKRRVEESE